MDSRGRMIFVYGKARNPHLKIEVARYLTPLHAAEQSEIDVHANQ